MVRVPRGGCGVGLYLVERFTRDRPVDYADDVLHFERGSTGGEKMNGIPYWYWVALPELFPEYLPDKKPGRGYSSFGMIYAEGDDPRYALPYGMSMRNVRGIDVVYLNCGACHIGTVRDAPGASRASRPRNAGPRIRPWRVGHVPHLDSSGPEVHRASAWSTRSRPCRTIRIA